MPLHLQKTTMKPLRTLALFFALSAVQVAQPLTAFCDLQTETLKPQQRSKSSEQPHQAFGHMDELQPGDLVFFQTRGRHINHVGIFIGNDTFIHSSLSKGITEDKLKQGYFDKSFAGAVRLLNVPGETLTNPSAQPETNADNSEPS